MTNPPPYHLQVNWQHILKSLLKTTGIILLLYSLVGFFILPVFFTMGAPFLFSEETEHTISIGNARFNPYNFVLSISNQRIFRQKGDGHTDNQPLITIAKLRLDLDVTSLTRRALICRELMLDGLFMHFIRQTGSDQALTKLLDHLPGKNSRNLSYSLENLSIRNSEIIFEDLLTGTYQHAEKISLNLPVISNMRQPGEATITRGLVKPEFSAIINGIPTSFSGKTTRDSGQSAGTSFDLNFNNLDLSVLTSYLPTGDLLVEQGILDINLSVSLFVNNDGESSILLEGEGSIDEMRASFSPEISAMVGHAPFSFNIDPLKDLWQLASLSLQNAHFVHPDLGKIAAPDLLISGINFAWQDQQIKLARITGDSVKMITPAPLSGEPEHAPPNSWTIIADNIELQNSEIVMDFGDKLITLDKAKILITELSSDPSRPCKAAISSTVNGQGLLVLDGELSLSPLRGKMQFQVEELPVTSLRPILVSFFTTSLHKGLASATGKLSFPDLIVEGAATVSGIEADISQGRNSLKCAAMDIAAFKLIPAKQSLTLDGLIFHKPEFTAVITDRKRPTLAGFIFPPSGGNDSDQPLISASSISVVDGSVIMTDLTTNPPARIKIAAINTKMKNMVNQVGDQQPFSLQATLQVYPDPAYFPSYSTRPTARIEMNGKVGLFGKEPSLRSTLKVNAIDLNGLSPYLAPLIGYQPARGRLDLHTDITLQASKLTTSNRLVIKGLKLGQSISGRFNTPLAIALLTDPADIIRFDFKIHNDLQSPMSSYFGNLAREFRTILAKATTAPFALVSKDSAKDIPDHLPFEAGSTEIGSENSRRLQKLARIIKTRPLLMVLITGRADTYTDLQETKVMDIGTDEGKILKEMATARASAVKEALIAAGADRSRLQISAPADLLSEEILLDDRPASRSDITLQIAETR